MIDSSRYPEVSTFRGHSDHWPEEAMLVYHDRGKRLIYLGSFGNLHSFTTHIHKPLNLIFASN